MIYTCMFENMDNWSIGKIFSCSVSTAIEMMFFLILGMIVGFYFMSKKNK